ncbi:MerR family transcriptional regulator [Paractinoplanes atraurantiacus]|uniref:Serine/threonine protein phosphatase PrpC n=1 Tax=Paractinoplanes atraurantiacus TaxID=1036182 RepID=A0A285IED7_9ACTN|nr:MerR family transcriptional regulator [Actinoplanes atraurantiacus]SNY45311.1 Serine/threonine protein phosphatase PrpC [Actinoplanes atraurantiacus]
MGLLTIGGFARQAGLTPKALRLYDEMGLLRPAAVDAETGYRFYEPRQLERARLVAELRRIGMPLAEIAEVCGLEPAAAAQAVEAFWRRVTADTAARARLTSLLVADLTGRATTMSEIDFRFAAGLDAGSGRNTNEDSAYAGTHLLAVADGTRGPGGAQAAAAAVEAVRAVDPSAATGAGLLTLLAGAVTEADRAIRRLAEPGRGEAGGDDAGGGADRPVTTLTAMVRNGTRLALVHVGDTRAYLLRSGELTQLTQDHTWVRTQVDQGKLTPAEAAAHPRRALLARALGWGAEGEVDLALRTALPGDRYLLCSDGLSAVVAPEAIRSALAGADDPQQAVTSLIALAHDAGAPDNIAVAVAHL